MSAATLADFANANDAAAATTKKLVKQNILSDYFRGLSDEDLPLAIRFAGGRSFASTDERVLGASGAVVSDVILSIFPIDPGELHALAVQSGELGEALGVLYARKPDVLPVEAAQLTLGELSATFGDLSATGNFQNKKDLLRGLFLRCRDPREAAYLAKIIFSDLRTGVKEGVLQASIAQAFEKSLLEIQRCQLLVGDLGEVGLLARHDRLGSASFRLFHPIQFMLATPQETAADAADTLAGRAFYAEDKLDGIRAQIHKSGEGQSARVAMYTRTMDRTDASFPDIVAAVSNLRGEFLLDGEIVPYRDGVVLPFANIQKRLGRKVLGPKILREHPAVFIAFDILYRDGELLMDRTLRERRKNLADFAVGQVSAALLTPQIIEVSSGEEIDRAFCTARDCRNEGLVLKDPDSIYAPGRRGQAWLKLKTHLPTLDCVVTAAEYGHGKRRGTLSDYTFAVWTANPAGDGAALVSIGKAYSGVTDEEIAQLTELFLKLSRGHNGRVHAVEPRVVMEIAFDQIQKSARHASGFALRFPRIKRIRWDKGPEDADRLDRVIEIHQSLANTAHVHVEPVAPEPTLFDGIL